MHSFHVENVARDLQAIEVEEAEPEYQEEQQPEFEVVDRVEDQVPESDFTNSDNQQGKPRCILTQCLYISLSLLQILNIPVHYVYRS